MIKRNSRWYAIVVLVCLSGSVAAHHANSAYDRKVTVSLTGTVTRWQFINPHSGLWIDVVNKDGDTEKWSAEFQGTLDLYRHFSWNKDTFKLGDEITLVGFPARNGDKTIGGRSVIFSDGTEVNVRNAPD